MGSGDKETAIERISPDGASMLENWIDQLDQSLPKLKQFIIPGGAPAAAHLHLARTVCRRARVRQTVGFGHQNALIFLNRLSDFLFTAAREVNRAAGRDDILWQGSHLKKDKA